MEPRDRDNLPDREYCNYDYNQYSWYNDDLTGIANAIMGSDSFEFFRRNGANYRRDANCPYDYCSISATDFWFEFWSGNCTQAKEMFADYHRNDTALNFTEKYNETHYRYQPIDYIARPLPANYTRTRRVNCSDDLNESLKRANPSNLYPDYCTKFNETTPDYNNTGRWDNREWCEASANNWTASGDCVAVAYMMMNPSCYMLELGQKYGYNLTASSNITNCGCGIEEEYDDGGCVFELMYSPKVSSSMRNFDTINNCSKYTINDTCTGNSSCNMTVETNNYNVSGDCYWVEEFMYYNYNKSGAINVTVNCSHGDDFYKDITKNATRDIWFYNPNIIPYTEFVIESRPVNYNPQFCPDKCTQFWKLNNGREIYGDCENVTR